VLLQNEIPQEVNLIVARKAKAAGAQVWLNAAPARTLPDALLPLIDLMIVNRVEAEFYAALADRVPLLTTLGAGGVRYGGRLWTAKPVQVVSTHGAGDMFVGALAAAVVSGAAMEAAIDFAQSAAAWHIAQETSARDRMPPGSLWAHLDGSGKS
jgi:ribokinase